MDASLSLQHVQKTYGLGETAVTALDDITLRVAPGELVAVMGPSGSGKSTLLQVAAGLDTATAGEVRIGGESLAGLGDDALTRVRRDRIGFVFQSFNLVPTLDAGANIRLPFELARREPDEAWIRELVEWLGIGERLGHRPGQLSGGQQQRVAIARALATRPAVVFADEPTGALDSRTAADVLDLLESAASRGQSMLMVTHDPVAAERAHRIVFLRDGRVEASESRMHATAIATRMLDIAPRRAAAERGTR